jgi:hypothetical protein
MPIGHTHSVTLSCIKKLRDLMKLPRIAFALSSAFGFRRR